MKSRSPSLALALCAAALFASRVAAQGETAEERVVQLQVVSATDTSVYVNHGRDVGLRPGNRITLYPPGAGELEVVVTSVSHTSARADMPPGVVAPPVGTRGEANVQVEAAPAPATTPRAVGQAPEHPPWARQEGRRGADQPLLVPTFGQRPDERPMSVNGRLFTSAQWNQDLEDTRAAEYLLSRTGVRADVENGLGLGERVRFAGEFDYRRVVLTDTRDETDRTFRPDLFSIALGTEAYAPGGVEVGRFLSPYLPEIGLIDGVEGVLRFEGGLRMGGGFGAYPRPFPARETGDDVGAHLFVDYVADDQRTFAVAFGAQKTWHKGAADRDLLIQRVEWRPAAGWSVLLNTKVDVYTASDTLKGSGVELTELLAQARYTQREWGLGLVGSHFAWPQLKRFEYQFLTAQNQNLVQNGKVDRVSLSGWWRPFEVLTVRLRGDHYQDQLRSGTSLRGDVDWRSPWGEGSMVQVSVYRSEGGYSSGPGGQLSLSDRLFGGRWRAAYRWQSYTIDTLVTGNETYSRRSIAVGYSCPLGTGADLDFSGERWFGDGIDALAIGLYLQWRF